jgi:hypothetical protein
MDTITLTCPRGIFLPANETLVMKRCTPEDATPGQFVACGVDDDHLTVREVGPDGELIDTGGIKCGRDHIRFVAIERRTRFQ